ncbi:uncharacterized protein LOC112089922 [Eutrema salsugineum]|uniref:uncharacterized protein LOC112089922 n=1 Tax=Eutrema salsugineum TaxID=72664 RepID=UPI000CECE4B9|nr:uncharacterized protein LOC112089922 [Eutrema salsugineum]
MSNHEKTKIATEEEINGSSDNSGYLSNVEEGKIGELVCALPALNVSERLNMEEAGLHNAVVAAELVIAASEEAVVSKGKMEQTVDAIGENTKNTKLDRRPRMDELDDAAGASGSTAIGSAREEGPVKKAKKNWGLVIDLNVDPMEKEEEAGSRSILKFDLNMSPPEDEDEEGLNAMNVNRRL